MTSDSNSSVLAELLSSNLGGPAIGAAAAVGKDKYKQLQAFQNVTSYSMQQTLHECPRKFQLSKLQADLEVDRDEDRESNVDFAFGHAVGAGVAIYDQTKDIKQAIFAAFLSWNIDLFADSLDSAKRDKKKNFAYAVWALYVYAEFLENGDGVELAEYEVVKLEANIGIDFENGQFYVGHIDELLRSTITGRYKVKENKTTGYASVDPALYENSDQALSYALVVDAVGAAEYDVVYTVYSCPEQQWLIYEFTKSPLAKAEWLQSQLFTAAEIESYVKHNFFPTRGANCITFNRRCQHFGSCGWSPIQVYGKNFSDLRICTSLDDLNEIETLDYRFKYSEVVSRQQEMLQLGTSSGQAGASKLAQISEM